VTESGNDKAPILEKKISELEGGVEKKLKKSKSKNPTGPLQKIG